MARLLKRKGTVVDEEGLAAVDHALHEDAHGARVSVLGPGSAARQDGLVEGQNWEVRLCELKGLIKSTVQS